MKVIMFLLCDCHFYFIYFKLLLVNLLKKYSYLVIITIHMPFLKYIYIYLYVYFNNNTF